MVYKEPITDKPIEVHLRIESYPNRFTDNMMIEITSKTEDYCIISLSEPSGIIRRMMGVNLSAGLNCIPILNIETYAPGSYTLDVKNYDGKSLYTTELTKH